MKEDAAVRSFVFLDAGYSHLIKFYERPRLRIYDESETLLYDIFRVHFQGLHDQAVQFSTALAQLESVQQQLTSSLGSNADLLKETRANFADNVSGMQKHVENLEQRMDALKKK